MTLQKIIEENLLSYVQSPSQYIGCEMNIVRKDWESCDVCVALGFPDVYKIGMSSLAIQIIYNLLNGLDNVLCERMFCPWIDAGDRMREVKLPLFSLESYHAVGDFDIFAISVPYEMLYTNVLEMLDLAGMNVWSKDRGESEPLVVIGGAQAHNPQPLGDFIDAAIIGEAEATLPQFIERYRRLKSQKMGRVKMLEIMAGEFDWLYVPRFYKCEYNADGTIKKIEGPHVKKAIVRKLDDVPYPTRPLVPFHEVVHNRINIEIMRGCPHSCRFCHEGYTRKPVRFRSQEKIIELAQEAYANTGIPEISLCSLSSADYPNLVELFSKLNNIFSPKKVSIALPSLRVQDQLKLIPSQTSTVRKTPLTIALEAGTERLRKIIGKDIDLDNLKPAVMEAYRCGWRQVKLYFMIGLPSETEEDLLSIVELASQIGNWRKEAIGRPAGVVASISFMVPKPDTPMQWVGQKSLEYFDQSIWFIRQSARRYPHVKITWHDRYRSRLEAIFARGDDRLSQVLYNSWKSGARFDSWDETFRYERFMQAFETAGLDPDFYANRNIGLDEILAWDHIEAGFDKEFLIRHFKAGLSGQAG